MAVLGIDVGTQGARAVVCADDGAVLGEGAAPLALPTTSELPPGHSEQDSESWWSATAAAIGEALTAAERDGAGGAAGAIAGVAVTSTSGTVCVVDAEGRALVPALMYNDQRATAEAAEASALGAALEAKLGYRFASSFALPKLAWLCRHRRAAIKQARHFLSPTDFIVGRLCGRYNVTDYTNALKTGYDLIDDVWPAFIADYLGVRMDRLPRVVAPGAPIGEVTRAAAAVTGLRAGTQVLAGMTDGCASQVATGAVALGDWNSTLGTTLVLKGVTSELVRDPLGRVYCHRHPDGYWLPGGASSTGAECIAKTFAADRLPALAAAAAALTPTGRVVYPLARVGERFPFVRADARGFALGDPDDEATSYTAHLEGVAYVERLCYDVLRELGAAVGDAIHVAGGTAKVAAWSRIRADVLQKTLLVPATAGGAMGAAIVAAGRMVHGGLVPAARAMVKIVDRVEPRPAARAAYDDAYERFRAALAERGYL